MALVRKRTVLVHSTGPQTHHAVLHALASSGMEILDQANPIRAKSPRALLKNRWAADLTIEIAEDSMVWTIDAAGDKHEQITDELLAKLPAGMVDDQGVNDAISRLAKASRFFGMAEIGRLAWILTPTERVVAIAIGNYEKRLGAAVLTTERLVFFDRSFKSRDIEEFSIDAIQSLGVSTRLGNEKISIAIAGRKAEISSIRTGEGEALVAAFRQVRDARSAATAAPAMPSQPDAMDQLRQLGELHQAGILTDDEFASKKSQLLDRM